MLGNRVFQQCWIACLNVVKIIIIILPQAILAQAILGQVSSWLKSFRQVSFWCSDWAGWKTKQRQTRKPRRDERAAARTLQSSSTRSQLSSSTPSTSSEREREVSWKLKPQRSSTTCSTPSCKGFVFNDRISKEPHCRYCGQAFTSTGAAQQPKRERQELLALAAELRAIGDTQTAQRLEEPSSPTRLLKAWNASKKCGCAEDKSACGNA